MKCRATRDRLIREIITHGGVPSLDDDVVFPDAQQHKDEDVLKGNQK